MDKNCGVYKITSPSGKVYIGQSIDIKRRFIEYKRLYSSKLQTRLYKSLLKHGVENHQFDIIEYCLEEDLDCSERFWQDEFDVLNRNGLNSVLQNCGNERRKYSEELLKNKSIRMSGENNPMYGKKGVLNPNYGKHGNLNYNWGNTHSEEQKKKWSEERKGCKSNTKKEVIDTLTNRVFCTAKEASDFFNINYSTLRSMLQNRTPNITTLVYLDKYEKGDYKILQNRNREPSIKVVNEITNVIYSSVKEAAEKEGIKYGTLFCNLKKGCNSYLNLKIFKK